MPRDIPVGNGNMLVTFDSAYQIRDVYFPHVGQENHAGGGPCRFGVWSDVPRREKDKDGDRRKRRLFWSHEHWDVKLGYQPDTLATDVTMKHEELQLEMRCCDAVDFHRPVLIRRIEVVNHADHDREVRLIHHHDFYMYATKIGDTAYYDPQLRSLIHYRKQRYIMASFYLDGEQQIDEYATGTAGFRGAEGTWRDAEDGHLGNNAIAQGAVDSTMLVSVQVPARGMRVVYLVIGCGFKYDDLEVIHRFLHREGPQGVIDRTVAYWRLWLAAVRTDFPKAQESGLSEKVIDLFKRSLLVVRTQIDNGGAIIAANDSDIMQFSRDTYSYLWPRDGAFVADGLDAAGFPDVCRSFFTFCSKIIEDGGYFLHKYNPDGSPASSWHPWVANGKPQLPIQEDETALVVWALWRHYVRYRDIEFVRPLWVNLIQKAADFMVRFRDPQTRLPLPSYDLWEERWGVHAFTVATVYGGLKAAWQFAVCFGDTHRASTYATAAEEVREAFEKHLWSQEHGRFLRRVVPLDHDRTAELMADVMAGRTPQPAGGGLDAMIPRNGHSVGVPAPEGPRQADPVEFELDPVIDSSMYAIFAMGLLPVEDDRVARTMKAIEDRLWCRTDVGGVARYEDDYYHQVSRDTDNVPGNPWFICTLWLAEYRIARAQTIDDLREALPILEWCADHALPSGVLAEQVHPELGWPMSVSPLTWSHATVVSVVVSYISKLEQMSVCPTCGQAKQCLVADVSRLRRPPIEIAERAHEASGA
jgi:glucoamylase